MSSDYKISIILPIFNVERFLKAALDSIISQTIGFENLEVIMVDDCSTDNSWSIMLEYSEKYDNFKAIRLDQNSRTAGKPRNVGLDNATADYILFLDSDDEFIEDICERLYNKLIEEDADAVTANAICIMSDKQVPDIIYPDNYYEISPNRNLELFKPFRVWGTLYKKSLIEKYNMRFIRASTNDDTHFVYNYFLHSNKIIYLNDYMGVKYYERDVEDYASLTHNISKFNIITTFEAFIEILKLISKSKPTKDFTNDPFIKNIFSRFIYKWDMSKQDKIEIFEKVIEYEKISNYNIILPFQYKFMNYLLKHRLFSILIMVQSIYSSFVMSSFSKKFLVPRIGRNIVD